MSRDLSRGAVKASAILRANGCQVLANLAKFVLVLASIWTEIVNPRQELERLGEDYSLTPAHIKSTQVSFTSL